MNKSIKKLAQAKAGKFGGEDSPDQRRRLKAKPYRTERVSQTETPEMGTYDIHRGGDSEGNSIGWNEKATYNADNKGYSATMGRSVKETKGILKKYGYTDKEAGLDAVQYENFRRDTTVKGSDFKKYEDSGWNPKSRAGRAVEGAEKKYDVYIGKSAALGRKVNRRLYNRAIRGGVSPAAPVREDQEYWKG